MSTLAEYKETRAQVRELQKKAASLARTAFDEGLQKLFKKHKSLNEVAWTQYTPYFNDGSPCEFGTNTEWPEINGEEFYPRHSRDSLEGTASEAQDPQLAAGYEVCEFLQQFDDDDYEEMFGDHVRVIATRDGITTEEYNHD